MIITGYKLIEALKMKKLEIESLQSQYEDSLYAFPDDEKLKPQDIISDISRLEIQVSLLQTAQCYYNVAVEFDGTNGKRMHLENAINLVGAISRQSHMWKIAAKGEKRSQYSSPQLSRSSEEIVAKPTIDKKQALQGAKQSEQMISQLRSLIALANNTQLEISFIDESLLN